MPKTVCRKLYCITRFCTRFNKYPSCHRKLCRGHSVIQISFQAHFIIDEERNTKTKKSNSKVINSVSHFSLIAGVELLYCGCRVVEGLLLLLVNVRDKFWFSRNIR